jgi:putative transposase
VTHSRQRLFDEAENVDRLREGFRRTMKKHPFKIDAIAMLPDHLHTIWQLPENDSERDGFRVNWWNRCACSTLPRLLNARVC